MGDFVHDMCEPILRINYLSDTSISAFAGSVGLAGMISEFKQFEHGAVQMPENLIKASNAQLNLNTKVISIAQNPTGYTVEVESDGKRRTENFDIVVLAAPIEFANLKFKNIEIPNLKPRKYRECHVTLVQGELSKQYFGFDETKEIPKWVCSKESPLATFSMIFYHGKNANGDNVYKMYSRNELTDELLDVSRSIHLTTLNVF